MGPVKKDSGINSFLLILNLSVLFIGMFALATDLHYSIAPGKIDDSGSTLGVSIDEKISRLDIYPKYTGGAEIEVLSKSALAIDTESGLVLYEKNSQEPVMPASTSKVITALVALDAYGLDQRIIVPNISVEGSKINLKEGENISVEDLLYGLLVSSANDAAEVLAAYYPGGRNIFIAKMNSKAQNLGLRKSVFVNPTGLDEPGQTTTAQDLVKASFYAMQNPVFEKIVSTKNYNILGLDGNVSHRLYNINQLLGEVDGVKGVKTGKTEGAMENLITYVERGNSKIMIALLGSTDRFADTTKLIDWIYDNYTWSN